MSDHSAAHSRDPHRPVAGIVLLALGWKKTVALMGTEPVDLWSHVKRVAGIALAGGVALYLAGHIAFRLRPDRWWSGPRAAAALACLALAVAAPAIRTLALLVAVSAVMVGLVVHEYRRMGWFSYHLRHAGHGSSPDSPSAPGSATLAA